MGKLPQEVVDKITGILFPTLTRKMDKEYDGHFGAHGLTDVYSKHDPSGGSWHSDNCFPTLEDLDYQRFGASLYATVSLAWKRSIERLTFRMLKIRNPSDAIIAEEAMARDQHRRQSVRRIAWTIKLDFRNYLGFPDIRDKLIVIECRKMLELINRIRPSREAADGDLLLSINIVGMDLVYYPERDESAFTAQPADFHDLPLCPAVTGLEIFYNVHNVFPVNKPIVGTKVPPVWVVEILSKLPSVTIVDWELYDFLSRNPGKRRRFHNDICKALSSPPFGNLQVLHLYIGSYEYIAGHGSDNALFTGLGDHLARNPSPSHGEDSLNVALRIMSQNLVDLSIRGTFTLSPEFFQKRKAEAHVQLSWPRLQRLSITTTNITCTGNLYVPDANSKDPFRSGDDYRAVWINDVLARPTDDFNDLMLSLSRGMLRMPKLERLEIRLLANPSGASILGPPTHTAQGHAPWVNVPDNWKIRIHGLVNYDRKASQAVPLADCTSSSSTTARHLSCNLCIFDEDLIHRWIVGFTQNPRQGPPQPKIPKPLLWGQTESFEAQEEIFKNWNELHFRIKGNSVLPEWRMEPGKIAKEREAENKEYPWYPVIKPAQPVPATGVSLS